MKKMVLLVYKVQITWDNQNVLTVCYKIMKILIKYILVIIKLTSVIISHKNHQTHKLM
jgi:hypothetical protein